jgi:hypothetical protein
MTGGLLVSNRPSVHSQRGAQRPSQTELPPGLPGRDYRPVVTPNGATLPFRVVNGIKVFHLIAEPVAHEFAPGLEAECWGFNGRVHGPTVETVEGDHIRIYVTNRLPAATSIHWHGIHVPNGMDGVAGLTQQRIETGETFKYEYSLAQHGTFMYHSHQDEMTQMALGLMGMFVVHPRQPEGPPPDRDFALLLSEWKITPGARRPDPIEMVEFNVLAFNARVFPGTEPLVVRRGDRVRIRIGNLSATDHHPIHLHGMSFRVAETDGGIIPEAGRWPESTVLVPVGSTRTIELVAENPGDWAFHCHMTHHTMNQMGHGLPNLVGVDPSIVDEEIAKVLPDYLTMAQTGMEEPGELMEQIPKNSIPMMGGPGPLGILTMGGMFTILKVREGITTYEDPGWYDHPPDTVAQAASPKDLEADGIKI